MDGVWLARLNVDMHVVDGKKSNSFTELWTSKKCARECPPDIRLRGDGMWERGIEPKSRVKNVAISSRAVT